MVPDRQGWASHEIPNHWISPTLDPSFFAFWTVQFHRLSIFSLLDRLVREGNCFIYLGLFSTVLISIELSNFHWPFYLFYSLSNFSCTFQLQPELSDFGPNFSTPARTFQLQSFQFHIGLSNFSFFPTILSYTYPEREYKNVIRRHLHITRQHLTATYFIK